MKYVEALLRVFFISVFLRVKRICVVPYFHHSFLFAAAIKKVMLLVVESIKKQYKEVK
ncbi:hypothetical protein [Bartonella machadoae]|uniref:hypothetical protein n=1 Tax=Bartonella machadoae TaxID=2893471 RepID=UPI001F4CE946|nr:hypothetical protein [Bartonella machadoae]UNE53540.1 hypothetical protein LNM86_07645 [Bartonella machadoae]